MEEKRREVGSPSPAATLSGGSSAKSGESPASEPPAPRRRGQKRKSIATTTSGSSSAPPKRQHVREKAAAAAAASAAGISSFLPPFHNGPLTRARQLSDTNAVLNAVKEETAMAAMRDTPAVDRREEDESRNEEFKEFQDAVDAEFEAIRSRDANSHVVPVATGWFSWTKLHPLEKHSLPSFFNGKSESRTPEVYMDIRNWIVKRFHANPSTNIELKDLSALSMGDSDARQEVLEFLDHWGLINYHPFPQNNSANADSHPDPDPNTDDDMIENTDSLIKKLFQFENEQSFPDLVPRANTAQPMPTGLLRESAIAEEFIKQEGPAVEYHCNSCSADCSRKRYHCQKQADFDLCTECFNNGKFGSGMSSSDFILMEPGEASGASGGKWTDQETLLLLEALELFKENWNEIAEHVATKTKAQCILHFLQMPIEDGFLDDNVTKNGVKDIGEPALASNDVSVPKDTLDPSEERNSEDNPNKKGSGSGVDNSELLATKAAEDDPEPSETQSNTDPSHATQPSLTTRGTPDLEEAEEGKSAHEKGDDVILKALMEAFDAVGFPVGEQDNLCFAEAGNSVMTVAAFLTQLVEPNLATASARTSLKSVSRSSPGLELSARHCFILEGPPDDKKELTKSEITATENGDEDAQNVVSQQEENCKEVALNEENITDMDEDRPATLLKGSHSADGQVDEKNSSDPGDNQGLPSASRDVLKDKPEFAEKLDGEKADVAESSNEKSQAAAKSDEDSGKENPRGPEKLDEEKSQVAEKQSETTSSEQAGSKGVIEPANRTPHSDQSHPDKEGDILGKVMPPLGSADVSGNMHAASEDAQSIDAHKDIDMKSGSVLSDKSEQQESVLADPVVGVGLATGEDKMDVDKSQDVKPLKIRKADDDENVAKLKRAALATLSAAAVKAKLLADQEEAEIKQLATVLIDKQVRKLEIKMNFFTEMEGTILRVREHLERSRQKLFAERAQIIASRLGIPPSARGGASSHPLNRMPVGLLNSVLRPSMNMGAQRPPMPRPVMAPAAPNSNTCAPPVVAGDGSAQPMAAEKPSPAATD